MPGAAALEEVPPRPAPPLLEVAAADELELAELLLVGLLDEELVGLVALLVAVPLVVVLLLAVVGVVLELAELLPVVDVVQLEAASAETVPAPCTRFWISFWVTVPGRSLTSLVSVAAACWAWAHWPAATAAEIECSWPARLADCPAESRPLLLPQATTNAAANPRPPARNAREPKPMPRLTLDIAAVCFGLGPVTQLLNGSDGVGTNCVTNPFGGVTDPRSPFSGPRRVAAGERYWP
ncbi:MAG: hypothetical protein ACRDL5_03835 [Solirubrobacteraceae bacterium]